MRARIVTVAGALPCRLIAGCCALLASGCLSGSHAYLKLSMDYRLPPEYGDPRLFGSILDAWTRDADLGLESAVAATLEDPAVGEALVSLDAQANRSAGPPGSNARATWDHLYGPGDRLPIDVRWRFDRRLYDSSVVVPGKAWTFTLSDDLGHAYAPLSIGKLTSTADAADWSGRFTIWFPRKSIGGRLLFTPHTRKLTMHIVGSPGQADLTWRFLPLLGRAQYGLYDSLDSPDAQVQIEPAASLSPEPSPLGSEPPAP